MQHSQIHRLHKGRTLPPKARKTKVKAPPKQKQKVKPGSFIAVKSVKYSEKLLIGKVLTEKPLVIEWWVGTFTGTWKEWVGREDRKRVVYTEQIDETDILCEVTFTPSRRLAPGMKLKMLYKDMLWYIHIYICIIMCNGFIVYAISYLVPFWRVWNQSMKTSCMKMEWKYN